MKTNPYYIGLIVNRHEELSQLFHLMGQDLAEKSYNKVYQVSTLFFSNGSILIGVGLPREQQFKQS